LKNYVDNLLRVVDAYRQAAAALPADDPALQRADRLCTEADLDFIREDAPPLLDESRKGLERVTRIVADLKEFSRVGESLWQPADVHRCLENTLNVVASELRHKATIVRNYGVLPEIRCMPFQLNQVFMNLLLNAVQAVHEPGTITVGTGRDGECVWIDIKDDGAGIPPEHLKRLFEPFFTTKPVGTGTGLGLSVAYGIVQQHGGRIEVSSEVGRGSVFRVLLPIDPPAEA
jgi:signal transduction histidine kinase